MITHVVGIVVRLGQCSRQGSASPLCHLGTFPATGSGQSRFPFFEVRCMVESLDRRDLCGPLRLPLRSWHSGPIIGGSDPLANGLRYPVHASIQRHPQFPQLIREPSSRSSPCCRCNPWILLDQMPLHPFVPVAAVVHPPVVFASSCPHRPLAWVPGLVSFSQALAWVLLVGHYLVIAVAHQQLCVRGSAGTAVVCLVVFVVAPVVVVAVVATVVVVVVQLVVE
mmetsp:Transcript_16296/g.37449  ORF Transcript_16296/g.37449 Transcript_16296/m.37449 type:complete len:224 (-) Transcript_16296:150-821(-)